VTELTWHAQKARLIDRFGKNAFTPEFSLLVALDWRTLPDQEAVTIVNVMIGNRKHTQAPLLQDFRDARLAYERRRFEADVRGASRAMNEPARFQGLKAYLAREFPGCKSLAEAVEVRKLQIQIQRAEDPHYDPMKDRKWMGEHAHLPRGTP
jgi:hypothetical protein